MKELDFSNFPYGDQTRRDIETKALNEIKNNNKYSRLFAKLQGKFLSEYAKNGMFNEQCDIVLSPDAKIIITKEMVLLATKQHAYQLQSFTEAVLYVCNTARFYLLPGPSKNEFWSVYYCEETKDLGSMYADKDISIVLTRGPFAKTIQVMESHEDEDAECYAQTSAEVKKIIHGCSQMLYLTEHISSAAYVETDVLYFAKEKIVAEHGEDFKDHIYVELSQETVMLDDDTRYCFPGLSGF